ncbi:RDD family protein [Flavobacterium sp. MAH-1]|uniref:RDD family protein n=1 Tax=Flavobacterium agri TaxID=2743471 RepID=A0A7Y8Y2A6_9FLAO|nr:RDD family protein [Flavobacterium agri]NUY81255.1 RDD family protein [Flavobacterium agri]NYA71279.1 RDD family protein [Flavobacterium agri]
MKQTKGSRMVAFLIDIIATTSVNFVVKDWFSSYHMGNFSFMGQEFDITIRLSLLVIPLYFLIFDLFNQGKTAGKLVMGIVTVDAQTQVAPDRLTLMVRTLFKFISIAFWPLSFLFFVISATSLQDIVAKTVTLKTK